MTNSLSTGFGSVGSTSSGLLERVRSHDQDAWRRLVHLYAPLVDFWLARARLQQADAQDLFQEVFKAVAAHIEQFRKDRPGSTFRGWLRAITHNKVADFFRNRAAHPPGTGGSEAYQQLQALPEAGQAAEASEAIAVRQLRLRALELIRGEFEDRTWEMFWAVMFDLRTTEDVAQTFGVTQSAVRQAKSRVLRRLHEELGDIEQ